MQYFGSMNRGVRVEIVVTLSELHIIVGFSPSCYTTKPFTSREAEQIQKQLGHMDVLISAAMP